MIDQGEINRRLEAAAAAFGKLPTDFFDDLAIFDLATEEAAELGEPRCRFIEAALLIVNLSWEDPKTRDEYVRQMFLTWQDWGPGRPNAADEQQARAMSNGSMSLCGVTTQNVWAAAGVDLPYLYTPYPTRFGSAVTRERATAIEVGAWVDALPWRRGTPFPEGGDAMIIGDNTPAMARGSSPTYQHELNVLAWAEGKNGVPLMLCMDGGQPGTAFRTRGLVEVFPGGGDAGELWCSTVNPDGSVSVGGDGRPLNGRRAIGFVNVSKLPFKASAPSCKGGGGGVLRAVGALVGGLVLGVAGLCLAGHCPAPLQKLNPLR